MTCFAFGKLLNPSDYWCLYTENHKALLVRNRNTMIKSEETNEIHLKFIWEEDYFVVSLEILSKSKQTYFFVYTI